MVRLYARGLCRTWLGLQAWNLHQAHRVRVHRAGQWAAQVAEYYSAAARYLLYPLHVLIKDKGSTLRKWNWALKLKLNTLIKSELCFVLRVVSNIFIPVSELWWERTVCAELLRLHKTRFVHINRLPGWQSRDHLIVSKFSIQCCHNDAVFGWLDKLVLVQNLGKPI